MRDALQTIFITENVTFDKTIKVLTAPRLFDYSELIHGDLVEDFKKPQKKAAEGAIAPTEAEEEENLADKGAGEE